MNMEASGIVVHNWHSINACWIWGQNDKELPILYYIPYIINLERHKDGLANNEWIVTMRNWILSLKMLLCSRYFSTLPSES